LPGSPGNGIEISRLQAPVPIDIAYGGSCTGGKREDLRRYHEVLRWALERGLGIAPGTRFYLQFGSQDVREHCIAENMMDVFGKAGVELVEPGCGACINAGPGISERPEQVTVSAINRNFPGRSGPGQVWLARRRWRPAPSPGAWSASGSCGNCTPTREGHARVRSGRGSSSRRRMPAPSAAPARANTQVRSVASRESCGPALAAAADRATTVEL
jgi:hypothetical protein